MKRGEVWFAATPGGDRPVLVLTRDPVAGRIGSVVVAALTRTRRGLVSELDLTASSDGVPTDCIVNFDNLHTLARESFRSRVTTLSSAISQIPSAIFLTGMLSFVVPSGEEMQATGSMVVRSMTTPTANIRRVTIEKRLPG